MWLLVSRLYAKNWLRGLVTHRDLMSVLGAIVMVATVTINWQAFRAIGQQVSSPQLGLSVLLIWFSIVGFMGFVMTLLLLIFIQLDNSADSYLMTLPLKEFDLRLGQLAPMLAALVVAAVSTSLGALLALAKALNVSWLAVVLMGGGVGLQTLAVSLLVFTVFRLSAWGLSRVWRLSETVGSVLVVAFVLGIAAVIFFTGYSFLLVPCLPGFWIWRILTGASTGSSMAGVAVCTLLPLVASYYVLKGVHVRWHQTQRDKVAITWGTPLPNEAAVHATVFALAFFRYRHIGRQLLASASLGFVLIGGTATYLLQHLTLEVQSYALDSLRSFCWLVAGINGGFVALTMSNMDRPFRWFYDSTPIRETSFVTGRLAFFVGIAAATGLPWMALLEATFPITLMRSGLDWAIFVSILLFQALLGYVTGRATGHDFDTKVQMTGIGVFLVVSVPAFLGFVALGEALTRVVSTPEMAVLLAAFILVVVTAGVALWVDHKAAILGGR